MVFRNLITANTTVGLAFPSGTLEKVFLPAILISNVDVGFEEAIDSGAPQFLKMCWGKN
jgi:hypothetical protein